MAHQLAPDAPTVQAPDLRPAPDWATPVAITYVLDVSGTSWTCTTCGRSTAGPGDHPVGRLMWLDVHGQWHIIVQQCRGHGSHGWPMWPDADSAPLSMGWCRICGRASLHLMHGWCRDCTEAAHHARCTCPADGHRARDCKAHGHPQCTCGWQGQAMLHVWCAVHGHDVRLADTVLVSRDRDQVPEHDRALCTEGVQ